jgi:hypothetical protein
MTEPLFKCSRGPSRYSVQKTKENPGKCLNNTRPMMTSLLPIIVLIVTAVMLSSCSNTNALTARPVAHARPSPLLHATSLAPQQDPLPPLASAPVPRRPPISLRRRLGEVAYARVRWLGRQFTFTDNLSRNSEDFFGTRVRRRRARLFQRTDDEEEEDDEGVGDDAAPKSRRSNKLPPRTRRIGDDDDDMDARQRYEEQKVWGALARLETDMQLLDRLAGNTPQLSVSQFSVLATAVLASAVSPWLGLAEFVPPSMAAIAAAVGIAAEYRGKVAVADGKEVAAACLQCAAEAEGCLAAAERAKAITPLCVGVGATAATFALLVPVLLDDMGTNLQLSTELYLLCPLIAILAAAVAGLALQEVKSYCTTAIGIGNRRFARSGMVSRTWLSATEMIAARSQNSLIKWRSFAWSVLPAPIFGALCPGALPTKTIVVAALAAAEAAYYLARAEYMLARAADAVALKSRSAAVCDTYANQGARSAAILPFTSALAGLCAAATAAVVELPFVESLAPRALEMLAVSAFPAGAALLAAAASVSKARCEVDAEAAMQAASTLALPYRADEDPLLRPLQGVRELIRLTVRNSVRRPLRRMWRRWEVRWREWRRRRGPGGLPSWNG